MIVWMRHGESEWNVSGRLQGHAAHPALTDRGRAQVEAAVDELRPLGISRVLSSPLVRAQQSAEIVARALELPWSVDDRLIEMGLDEDPTHVVARLEPLLAEDRDGTVLMVSHGDTIPIAHHLLTGENLPGPLGNATVVTTP